MDQENDSQRDETRNLGSQAEGLSGDVVPVVITREAALNLLNALILGLGCVAGGSYGKGGGRALGGDLTTRPDR